MVPLPWRGCAIGHLIGEIYCELAFERGRQKSPIGTGFCCPHAVDIRKKSREIFLGFNEP
jgi:hypothetical protein